MSVTGPPTFQMLPPPMLVTTRPTITQPIPADDVPACQQTVHGEMERHCDQLLLLDAQMILDLVLHQQYE